MKRLTRLNTKEDIIATSRLMGNDKPITDEAINQSLELFKYVSDSPLSATQKLGKLEDIEDELGISIEALLKKPYFTIFYRDEKGIIQESSIFAVYLQEFCVIACFNQTKFYFKDYGKTWALTKEELENKGE